MIVPSSCMSSFPDTTVPLVFEQHSEPRLFLGKVVVTVKALILRVLF